LISEIYFALRRTCIRVSTDHRLRFVHDSACG
jgi:hypothetical protein